MSTTLMTTSGEAKDKLRPTGGSPQFNRAVGTIRSLQTKSNGRPIGGGGSPKLNGAARTVRSLKTKSGGRPTGGGGSPKLNGTARTIRSLQAKSNGRPVGGGGSPKLNGTARTVRNLKTKSDGRPTGGGGSPKIAAAYNSFGNDCIRLAAEQSALLDTAVVIYSRAIEYDPDDPGLMVNLAITNLLKGDTLTAKNLFVMAFVLCEDHFDQLYALMGLKHGQVKYPKENPLHAAESTLRATIEESVANAEGEAGVEPLTPLAAKEFLYVKRHDIGEK